jgi:anti-sigma B factor antagonist
MLLRSHSHRIAAQQHALHVRAQEGIQVDLSITRADHGNQTVVHLGGEIDVYTAPLVREKLDEQIQGGRTQLVVDLTDVTFLDSTGLGVLVGRLKLTRTRGGAMRLVGTDDRVLKVFSIPGLDKVFEIHPTLDAALAASEAGVSAPGEGS